MSKRRHRPPGSASGHTGKVAHGAHATHPGTRSGAVARSRWGWVAVVLGLAGLSLAAPLVWHSRKGGETGGEAASGNGTAPAASVPQSPLPPDLDPLVSQAIERGVDEARRLQEPEAFGRLGRIYHAHEFYDLAQRSYETAHRLDPKTADWPYYLGLLAAERGHNELAVTLFRRVLMLRPDYVPAYVQLGNALLSLGRLEDADQTFQELVRRAPRQPWGHLGQGRLARRRHLWAEAKEALVKASELDPGNREVRYLLAMTCREMGHHDLAREHLDALSRPGPQARLDDPLLDRVRGERKDALGLVQLANRLADSGAPEAAEGLYRLVLSHTPDHFDALLNLGILQGRQGLYDEAQESLSLAVRSRPRDPAAHHLLAAAYLWREDLTRAREELEAVLRLDPRHSEARSLLERLSLHTTPRR